MAANRIVLHVGTEAFALTADDAQKIVDATTTSRSYDDDFKRWLAEAIAKAEADEQAFNQAEAQALLNAILGGAEAAMALALGIAVAIAEVRAGRQPAPVELSPAHQSIVATALDKAREPFPDDVERLRQFLRVTPRKRPKRLG